MRCSCNNSCRQHPYKCTKGNWQRHFDPDYGRKMERFTVSQSDIMNVYRKKDLDNTVTSVVKD